MLKFWPRLTWSNVRIVLMAKIATWSPRAVSTTLGKRRAFWSSAAFCKPAGRGRQICRAHKPLEEELENGSCAEFLLSWQRPRHSEAFTFCQFHHNFFIGGLWVISRWTDLATIIGQLLPIFNVANLYPIFSGRNIGLHFQTEGYQISRISMIEIHSFSRLHKAMAGLFVALKDLHLGLFCNLLKAYKNWILNCFSLKN